MRFPAFGSLMPPTLIGIPFSTFTRTIALGLHEKEIQFSQVEARPHSDRAKRHNPFGKIPTLEVDDDKALYETLSIVRYLDETYPFPSLRGDNVLIDRFIGISSDHLFSSVEIGVVKPRLNAEQNGKDGKVAAEQGLAKLDLVLDAIEKQIIGPYLTGAVLTWADLFVYPPLADLRSIDEGKTRLTITYPKLSKWMQEMDKREGVQRTKKGTLEDMRS